MIWLTFSIVTHDQSADVPFLVGLDVEVGCGHGIEIDCESIFQISVFVLDRTVGLYPSVILSHHVRVGSSRVVDLLFPHARIHLSC